jgi:beta-1,2-mannobiose phosphorylase / 1,2-beta-oligomannan phosphorylase
VGGTFNPAAVRIGNTTHLLYRAVDANKISSLGYAQINDGTELASRSSTPVLYPSTEVESFGCEDPRITFLEGCYYIAYTAFSRRGPRLALASTTDFTHFQKYGLIGPDRTDKDWTFFPERINGKIALLHRLQSSIQIAYFDTLDSLVNSQEYWDGYVKHFHDYELIAPKFPWEHRKVGVGAPPIKTDKGWLLIYHGVSLKKVYSVGALLLDMDDPMKIIARTSTPILEPEMDFEKQGIVSNVVFPDGAIINDGKLYVYYGGADNVCCLATTPIDGFIDQLMQEGNV